LSETINITASIIKVATVINAYTNKLDEEPPSEAWAVTESADERKKIRNASLVIPFFKALFIFIKKSCIKLVLKKSSQRYKAFEILYIPSLSILKLWFYLDTV